MALAAQVLAIVALGVGRAAIDELMACGGPDFHHRRADAANRPNVQTDLARAEAQLRSARSFFYEVTEDAVATLKRAIRFRGSNRRCCGWRPAMPPAWARTSPMPSIA
jgi:alkylation response protein AidB-like acyl-CoA dehydrogenase